MKLKLIILLFVFSGFFSQSQVGMGKWRMHISPYEAISVAKSEDVIYAILSRGLLEYDLENNEQSLRTSADYLSDVSPTAIDYDTGSKTLFIGYDNGNLDMLRGNQIFNLPAILQSSIGGLKRINNIVCHDGNAYLATGFGVVVININKEEVKDTYNPTVLDENIVDLAILHDTLYVLTEGGIRAGALSNNFLADPAQWSVVSEVADYSTSGEYNALVSFEDNLFFSYNDDIYNSDTLYRFNSGGLEVFQDEAELLGLSISDNKLLVGTDGGLFIYKDNFTVDQTIYQYSHGAFPNARNAVYANGEYFIADGRSGLVKAANSFNSQRISFEGPRDNSAYRIDWQNGTLAIAAGGFSGTGPSFSKDGGYIRTEEGKWISVNPFNQPILANKNIWDFVAVAVNPSNTEEVAFGTFSEIPMVMMTDGVSITDTFAYTNSLLNPTTGVDGWGYVSDLVFDDNSNLWIANSYGDKPLKVRDENGVWFEFDLGTAAKNKRTTRVIIDDNDVKWMGADGLGVVAFDHGENIDDASDDRHLSFSTSPNGGDLPSSTVEAIAADFDNNIWIGTPEGMRVLYNSANVFDAAPGEYNFQKLLIEFGENVEIVLGTTHITDIEVDGANRKWIATASSGVFLLEPDGLEVVNNFTSENSPLLSNNVLDITIDQDIGEVYFVTNEGLISYRSDASQGDNSYSNVNVFPNPVHPDYFGPVTIQGIAYNSDVKITDVAGNLVYQTTSNGGTAIWNGQTLQGERVQTGVYLIWTSIDDQDRKGRKVGKVVFIN